ncbi:hydroxyacid dehydrogenase [Leifsonia aquatica]|uniref:hydroxyacid dehydrogenase n=1 Tax=Leifsonia aquatica TaxID=144185 RepID=UPI000AFE1CF8|nr:hydroxyacid dehydrogenase [Leifsonia aquatica]
MNTYGIVLGSDLLAERLFGPGLAELDRIPARRLGPVITPQRFEDFADLYPVEALATGWGTPTLDATMLSRFPNLKHIVHAGGISPIAPDATLNDIDVSLAADVNAVPVAEYTLAMILLARKSIFRSERLYRERRAYVDREVEFPNAGNAGGLVGIVGASRIGRMVIELLRPFQLTVAVCDPYLSNCDASRLGVQKLELPTLLTVSDVVTLHAPVTDETAGMIGRHELGLIRDGATLINTARGALVDTEALTDELRSRRISAVLDVTDPAEPLPPDSILWELPNVTLTPHMAGSVGNEIRRIGHYVADQLISIFASSSANAFQCRQH